MQECGKTYYTKMMIRKLFTIYTSRPFYVFSKAEWSIDQNIQYFIWSNKSVLVLLQLNILCTSTVKRYYA